jgi:hypothetical protein
MNIPGRRPSLVAARSMKRAVLSTGFLPLLLLLWGAAAGCSLLDTGSGEEKALQRVGVPARAEILSIAESGLTVNDNPVVVLEVEVRPTDRPAYRATIKRTLISRLEVPQFQPGSIIPVRFDPRDPSQVAFDIGPPKSGRTGNPFADNFTAESTAGASPLPPPPSPALYRGGADDAADGRALIENGYLPLGAAEFTGGAADPRQAAAQAKRVGAAVVVLYGAMAAAPGEAGLAPLPFQPQALPGAAGAGGTIGSLPAPARSEHRATYWARNQAPILGVYSRPLNAQERAGLMRKEGIMVELVAAHSPAAAAHIQPGDILLAIDGKTILDPAAVPAFIQTIAGRKVRIDLLRNGAPLAVEVQLNPAP